MWVLPYKMIQNLQNISYIKFQTGSFLAEQLNKIYGDIAFHLDCLVTFPIKSNNLMYGQEKILPTVVSHRLKPIWLSNEIDK